MVSDYDSMRLVHRRNNTNKETLIYIPLPHIIVIQVHTKVTGTLIIIITRLTHISRYVSRYRSQLTYIHI